MHLDAKVIAERHLQVKNIDVMYFVNTIARYLSRKLKKKIINNKIFVIKYYIIKNYLHGRKKS